MKVLCTYCESEGGSALLYEKEPLDDPAITHGICDRHSRQLLEEIQAVFAQEPPSERDRFPRLPMPAPVTCRAPQFPGTELRGIIRNLGPQGAMAEFPLKVAQGGQMTLFLQTWQETLEIQGQVVWTSGVGGRVQHGIAFLAPIEPGFLHGLGCGECREPRAA